MSYARKFSNEELEAIVSNMVTLAKISNSTFNVTKDNIVGLVDKIGKILTIDSVFTIDKLARFEGEYLSFGKTIEEWQQDLMLPYDYDSTGANALNPDDPTYRPVFYSYTLGRKVIKTTLRNDNIERAVHNEGQLAEIVAMQTKRLEDSMAQYRYAVKREMLAKFIGLCESEMNATTASAYAVSTAYAVNTLVKNGSPAVVGIVVKPIANTNTHTWDQAVSAGEIVLLNLTQTVAIPEDTTTGEAFIKAVRNDLEICADVSEGHSLNGNTIGAIEGVVLIMKQGIQSVLDVDTMAGAFHLDKIGIPAEIIVVKDFGAYTGKAYAVLMDSRAMRLHNTYNATRDNFNGDGDFVNLFRHTEDIAWISRNAFIKVYLDD